MEQNKQHAAYGLLAGRTLRLVITPQEIVRFNIKGNDYHSSEMCEWPYYEAQVFKRR
jgi:hypothetical protein